MSVATLLTAEQFSQMEFDGPVELVRGEVVEMTRPEPPHGNVCNEVSFALTSWAKRGGRGLVTTNDSGVLTDRDPDTVRGPDVAFYALSQIPGGRFSPESRTLVPTLCVEVLSPSNRWSEMRTKIEEYLACGVEEVWIVDCQRRTVEVFRRDLPAVEFKQDAQLVSRALPEFVAPVSEFFAGIE